MNAEAEIKKLLRAAGAKFLRQSRHSVYRLPDGTNWVVAVSPSDVRSLDNNLASLRRKLGVRKSKGKGVRRVRRLSARPRRAVSFALPQFAAGPLRSMRSEIERVTNP